MKLSETLAQLRKASGYNQSAVAEFINAHSCKQYSSKNISHWETGVSTPPIEQFLLLCELYRVRDIQEAFRGLETEFRGLTKLNALGKSRVEEYIALLSGNALFAKTADEEYYSKEQRIIRLYDVPVAAGSGSFLDSEAYEDFKVDKTVPPQADFAVKVSGDSMTPRFVDNQIVFIKKQQVLEIGDIGIFELDGDAYIKELGQGELLSLNLLYQPIKIHDYNSFHIFGKVVG
ncbi:MAG: XRE family transcriptional regulator [Firmicutes bacterium]|nr:XRE family transcriptional regulator [Bacillota bacterium]